ncbi:sulfite oxidase heme-binding subunit YedZ [Thiomicrorhabdus indica]|uniref:sulfite oxidase heme-binding subunit YedZ n=1 Tax=Thiomicrorhabdus indica TaxID=2267253 RepID=UPI00102DC03E|nr:protein-methionine-sulfoxide reductase heme-binding subunit MsrQ [Thiomicrorhabdus indica]
MSVSIRIVIFSFICALPAGYLVQSLLTGNLGANPAETLIHFTGDWTIYFLLLTLSISPIQALLKPKWPIPMHLIRRIFGLSAMAYAILHLSSYFTFDMVFDIQATIEDIYERPFILLGFVAFILLIPLTITSTQGWQRRLKKRWQQLHKLVYPITLFGIIHYIMLVKADLLLPLLYLSIFGLLMLAREAIKLKHRR